MSLQPLSAPACKGGALQNNHHTSQQPYTLDLPPSPNPASRSSRLELTLPMTDSEPLKEISFRVDGAEMTFSLGGSSGNGPTIQHSALSIAVESPNSLARTLIQPKPPAPCFLSSNSSASNRLYFETSNPSFLGYIEEPKGRPSRVGGYSDVWRCSIEFCTPEEALPREVNLETTSTHLND